MEPLSGMGLLESDRQEMMSLYRLPASAAQQEYQAYASSLVPMVNATTGLGDEVTADLASGWPSVWASYRNVVSFVGMWLMIPDYQG